MNVDLELQSLLDEIGQSFRNVAVPKIFKGITSQGDFEAMYERNEFEDLERDFYNLELEEIRFFLPYAMRSYLYRHGENLNTDVNLDQFLLCFVHFDDKNDLVRQRYLEIYGFLDEKQRKSICSFISFVKKNKIDQELIPRETIEFWCH